MGQGEWVRATLLEAWSAFTPFFALGLLAAAAIRGRASRLARSRASMRGTAIVFLLHLALIPLCGYLRAEDHPSYPSWRQLSVTLATVAGITIVLAIVFDGILRWLRADVPRIVQDVVAAAAYLVGGLFLLSRWGVNLSGLIATSAVLTAVIGFSLQDTLGNLMGGMTLQMEKSVRPGDWVKIGDDVGRVVEMRWRQTTIETRNWETIILPNSLLAKNQFTVLGRRLGQPVQLRRWVTFQVDYRFDPNLVISTIEEALRRTSIEGAAAEPPPDCVLHEMRDSFNNYAVRYFLTDLNRDEPIDSRVRTRVFAALRRASIPLTMPAHAVFLTNDSEERRERKERTLDQTREAVLRGAELFSDLSPEEIDELANGLRYSPFAPGEALTRQDSAGNDLYFIDRGTVSVRVTAGGAEREVASLGPGMFFGERSLMTGEPRSATTVAVTDVVCYRLAKGELEGVLKKRPELAEAMAEILARRETELSSHREHLSREARERHIDSQKRQIVGKIRSFFGL